MRKELQKKDNFAIDKINMNDIYHMIKRIK